MKKKTKKITIKDAQDVFNPYIRDRDSEDGYFICISCGNTLPVSKMNAGHYVPVSKSSYLRFHELNVHGECQGCNCFNEFHLIGYRKNLIEKIGQDAVDWLESVYRTRKNWSQSELREIITKYKKP